MHSHEDVLLLSKLLDFWKVSENWHSNSEQLELGQKKKKSLKNNLPLIVSLTPTHALVLSYTKIT